MRTTNTKAYAQVERLGMSTIGATQYPRLQFWSAEEYFEGIMPQLPPMADPYTGKSVQLDMFVQNV